MTIKVGNKVRLGGITGVVTGHRHENGEDIWIVDLQGVSCECTTRCIEMGWPASEWERACGFDPFS